MKDRKNIIQESDSNEWIHSIPAFLRGCEADFVFVSNKIAGFQYKVDFYFEDGIKELDYPNKTVIEIKNVLQSDTLYRSQKYFNLFRSEGLVNQWVIVFLSADECSAITKKWFQDDSNFSIYGILDFKKKLTDSHVLLSQFHKVDWKARQDLLLKQLSTACRNKNVSLFLGAGVGVEAKLPLWDQLLEELFKKTAKPRLVNTGNDYKDLDGIVKHSSLIMGRYVMDAFENDREKFRDSIREILYQNVNPSKLIDAIVKFTTQRTISSIFTYNYDDLIEMGLETKGYPYLSIYQNNRCESNELPIYHVHGFVPRNKKINSNPILSELDYHKLYKEAYHWSNVEQLHAFSRNTCIFIGLSMVDPNLRRLLDISQAGTERGVPHYLFVIRDCSFVGDEAELYYNKYEKIMSEFGINVIWYEQHDDLPSLLDTISND